MDRQIIMFLLGQSDRHCSQHRTPLLHQPPAARQMSIQSGTMVFWNVESWCGTEEPQSYATEQLSDSPLLNNNNNSNRRQEQKG